MKIFVPIINLILFLSILHSCNDGGNITNHPVKEGKAIVKGLITSPVDSFITFTYQGDPATGHQAGERYVSQLQPDGTFEIQLFLRKPVELYSDFGGKYITLYLEPNYSTNISFDGKEFEGVLYSGDGQEENIINQEITNFKSRENTRLNDPKAGLSFEEKKS